MQLLNGRAPSKQTSVSGNGDFSLEGPVVHAAMRNENLVISGYDLANFSHLFDANNFDTKSLVVTMTNAWFSTRLNRFLSGKRLLATTVTPLFCFYFLSSGCKVCSSNEGESKRMLTK